MKLEFDTVVAIGENLLVIRENSLLEVISFSEVELEKEIYKQLKTAEKSPQTIFVNSVEAITNKKWWNENPRIPFKHDKEIIRLHDTEIYKKWYEIIRRHEKFCNVKEKLKENHYKEDEYLCYYKEIRVKAWRREVLKKK